MKFIQSRNPVKLRRKDPETGELDLGGGLRDYSDPVFANEADLQAWVADVAELDRKATYVIVPAWI